MKPVVGEHPGADRLNAFLQGKLAGPDATAVEAHLDVCEPCCDRLYELTQRAADDPLLARLREAPAVPGGETVAADFAPRNGSPAGPDAAAAPGRVVAGYEIVEELGRGGMSVVYRARDPRLKREVALKMLRAEGRGRQGELTERFRAEAEIIARLRHDGIVQIHEVGEAAGRLYLVLELVEGGDLYKLTRHEPQPPRTAAAWVEVLARTTAFAHEHGVVHRDLKPSNVLVARGAGGPALKVTDFGLAKQLDAGANRTRTGVVMGTPGYMAPEQAAGRPVGPPADVYALGAILYELLTGRPPFQGDSVLDTLRRIQEDEPLPPRHLQPRVPLDLQTICLKCLEKDPAKRYPGALSLAEDLRRFQAGEPITARPLSPAGRGWKWCRRQPVVAGLLGGVVLSTGLGLGGVVGQWRRAVVERGRAEEKEQQAVAAREEAERALGELRREQDVKRQRGKQSAPLFLQDARRSGANRQLDYALAQVEVALEYDPELTDARLVKGQLLIVKGDTDAAAAELERYVRHRPEDGEAARLLALCRETRPGDPARPAAFAEVFLRQKQYGLAAQLEQDRDRLLQIYRRQLDAAWPGAGSDLRVTDGKLALTLSGRPGLTDLTPLRGIPVQVLEVSRCPVQDLTPLAGLPLTDLAVWETSVSDLKPLSGLRLTRLNLGSTPVRDLAPLAGMPLEVLTLRRCQHVHDLTPLRGMPLHTLDLSMCPGVRDLAVARDMPLRVLAINWTEVSDLTPILGLRLTTLELNHSARQQDLLLVRKMPLRHLDLGGCGAITDLTPLAGMNLEYLGLPPGVERGMDVVRRMTSLKRINELPAAEFWEKFDARKSRGPKPSR